MLAFQRLRPGTTQVRVLECRSPPGEKRRAMRPTRSRTITSLLAAVGAGFALSAMMAHPPPSPSRIACEPGQVDNRRSMHCPRNNVKIVPALPVCRDGRGRPTGMAAATSGAATGNPLNRHVQNLGPSGSCRSASHRRRTKCFDRWWHRLAEEHFTGTLVSSINAAQLDPLLGLDFRNVLGDALRAERGLARRLSRVALKVLATSCSSRTGSPAASIFRSCRPFKGGSRR